MNLSVPDTSDLEAVPPALPPHHGPQWRQPQAGYHRLMLALSLVVIAACAVLPAPGKSGEVKLPLLREPLPSFCMLKREFGIDCPGCGLTRCFLSLGHGDPAAAWGFHPVGVLLFAALLAQIPYRAGQLWRIRRGYSEWNPGMLRLLLWLLVAAILGQWFLRAVGVLSA